MTHHIISLGSTCSVAYQLQQYGMRTNAYPFDWVRSQNFSDVVKVIESKFDAYIESVTQISSSEKFPVFDTDDFPNSTGENNVTMDIMQNKYNIKFYHDFISGNLDNRIPVLVKYQRRIERFYDTIQSGQPILYIRDELQLGRLTAEDIIAFINIIYQINPDANFKLLFILHNPSAKPLEITNYIHPQVEYFVDHNKFGIWTRPNINWKEVFSNDFLSDDFIV